MSRHWFWGHVHEYGKWKTTDRGSVRYDGGMLGWYVFQKRTCAECGYVEINKQVETVMNLGL